MAKSPLHDNPRSSKDAEKKPDPSPAEKKAGEEAADAAGGEEKEPKAETKAETAEEKPASPKDLFMDGMKAIRKRHEGEHRDAHGNHREAMRQMSSRHSKEIGDHFDMHFTGGGTAEKGEAGSAKPAAASGTPAEGGGEE
jgi:hypothetical protein